MFAECCACRDTILGTTYPTEEDAARSSMLLSFSACATKSDYLTI